MKDNSNRNNQKQVGDKVGMLTLMERFSDKKHVRFSCMCDCGNTTIVRHDHLKTANTKSCGCQHNAPKLHGEYCGGVSPELTAYKQMIARCTNEKYPFFHCYGGRGITVCERWLSSVEMFIKDMGRRPRGCSLDRINVDGNYEPSNCRWATQKQQQRNRTNNRLLTIEGKSRCIAEWSDMSGIKPGTIAARLKRGWSENSAVWTPLRSKQYG